MPAYLYDLKQALDQHGIFFCFSGYITQQLVTTMLTMLEHTMVLEKADKATIVKAFSLTVEKAQNIIRYSDEKSSRTDSTGKEQEARYGILAVGYDQGHYFVSSGNLVETVKVAKLRDKLAKLLNMSQDELKHYYREQRKQCPDEDSKGAGLGFIEMAKRASQPLEFDFRTIDETMSFFSVKTVI